MFPRGQRLRVGGGDSSGSVQLLVMQEKLSGSLVAHRCGTRQLFCSWSSSSGECALETLVWVQDLFPMDVDDEKDSDSELWVVNDEAEQAGTPLSSLFRQRSKIHELATPREGTQRGLRADRLCEVDHPGPSRGSVGDVGQGQQPMIWWVLLGPESRELDRMKGIRSALWSRRQSLRPRKPCKRRISFASDGVVGGRTNLVVDAVPLPAACSPLKVRRVVGRLLDRGF